MNAARHSHIDALRGWAAASVVLVHSAATLKPATPLLVQVANEGARGVQLFFVLSAITLCASWSSSSQSEGKWRDFYIRRFFRIAPLFYLAMLAYVGISGLGPRYWAPNGLSAWQILLTTFFAHGFHPEAINAVVPGGWSIAVEVTFYAVLPFLLTRLTTASSWRRLLLASVLLSGVNYFLVDRFIHYPPDQAYLPKSFSYLNFFGQWPVFLIGVCAWWYGRKPQSSINYKLIAGVMLLFAAATIAGSLDLRLNRRVNWLLVYPHHFYAGVAFACLTLLLSRWPLRLLVNPLTIELGRVSYGIYLAHFGVILGFKWLLPVANQSPSDGWAVLFFLGVLAASIVLAKGLNALIEQPCIEAGKRLTSALQARQAVLR